MYLSLYRKYRPKTFDEIVGQEHITSILKNQVKSGKVGHAYLLTGARGTGKTSAARILSRAVNCEKLVDGNPCNECATCRHLLDPSNVDVLEIDAASNNRVDEIREIREKIQFTPVVGRYKVYIVDEVHMLSDSAFNALLKTLEEPPAHAAFILGTTEVQKLPATVLSRCMRFDFKLVGVPVISELLKKIFDDVGKKYEPEAVSHIAAAAEGSVRDALSIADMCISAPGKLKYGDVLDILGATDNDTLSRLAGALISRDIGKTLTLIDTLLKAGKSVGVLMRDLLKYFRNLLIIGACENPEGILEMPAEYFKKLQKEAESAPREKIFSAIEILSGAESDLRYTIQPRIVLEAAAVKIIRERDAAPPPSVPKGGAIGGAAGGTKESPPPPPASEVQNASALWGKVVRGLRERGDAALYAVAGNITGNVIDGNDYIINAGNLSDEALLGKGENKKIIKSLLESGGGEYNIIIKKIGGAETEPRKDDISKLEEYVGKNKLKAE